MRGQDVWLSLAGPGKDRPKACLTDGWMMPSYKGIDLTQTWGPDDWIGLRLDNWICADCDGDEARDAWLRHIDQPLKHTWVRKSPHGWHFYYRKDITNLTVVAHVPLKSVHQNIDLKTGLGHQMVFYADGYEDWIGSSQVDAISFLPAWVPPDTEQDEWVGEEWSEMPDGIGDNSMIAFAGTFRRWGMDQATIGRCLQAINQITMTKDPMRPNQIRRLARQAAKWNPEDARSVICPGCGAEVEYR